MLVSGMRVRQECCEFEGSVGRGRPPLSAPFTSGRRLGACVLWCRLQLAPTAVLRNLDSNVGLFVNACQAL
jgi:hypothetical protein